MASPPSPDSAAAAAAPPSSGDSQKTLDVKASRLVQAAQLLSDAGKRAYSSGVETTQVRARQVSDVVLENANRAKGSSKEFLSMVQERAGHYSGVAQERAGHYAGRVQDKAGHYSGAAQERAIAYKDNVSRAIQQSRDGEGEGEKLGFPLSVLVWCSTLCGGSKKKGGDGAAAPRELEAPSDEQENQYSSDALGKTADEYATALEEEANKLDHAVVEKSKKGGDA